MPVSLNTWQIAALILASAWLWLWYVRHKDRHQPEPLWRLLLAFGLGVVACVVAVLTFNGLDALGIPDLQFNERPWTAVYCFGFVGPIEEGTKVLLAYLFVFRWRDFDEPMDGFVYSSVLALGFASAENFRCVMGAGWLIQLGHTAALPITHVLFSSIWGFGIGYARFCVSRPSHRVLWQIGSIALSMLAHGLYDFLIFAYQATLLTSGLALALWVFAAWRAQALRQQALARQALTRAEKPEPPGARA